MRVMGLYVLLSALLVSHIMIWRVLKHMAVNQSQFDQDMAALVAAVTALLAAYASAKSQAPPEADFSAEDAQVQAAVASINSALATSAPAATTVPTPPAA